MSLLFHQVLCESSLLFVRLQCSLMNSLALRAILHRCEALLVVHALPLTPPPPSLRCSVGRSLWSQTETGRSPAPFHRSRRKIPSLGRATIDLHSIFYLTIVCNVFCVARNNRFQPRNQLVILQLDIKPKSAPLTSSKSLIDSISVPVIKYNRGSSRRSRSFICLHTLI